MNIETNRTEDFCAAVALIFDAAEQSGLIDKVARELQPGDEPSAYWLRSDLAGYLANFGGSSLAPALEAVDKFCKTQAQRKEQTNG